MAQEHTNQLEPLHGKLISMVWKPGFMAIRSFRVSERFLHFSVRHILNAVLVSERPFYYGCSLGQAYQLTECVLLDSGVVVHRKLDEFSDKTIYVASLCLKTLHPTDGVRLHELTFRTTTPDWDLIEITNPEESTPPS